MVIIMINSLINYHITFSFLLDTCKDQVKGLNERIIDLQQENNQMKSKITEVTERDKFLKVCIFDF